MRAVLCFGLLLSVTILVAIVAAAAAAVPSVGGAHRARRHRHGLRIAQTLDRDEERRDAPASPTVRSGADDEAADEPREAAARPAATPSATLVQDKCRHHQCGSGRVCKLNGRAQPFCDCVPEDACRDGRRKVCGSDGVVYDSHCHLHRIACVEGRRLRAADSWDACEDSEDASDASNDDGEEEEDGDGDDDDGAILEPVGATWLDASEQAASKESASVKKDLGHHALPKILEPASSSSDLAIRCDRASFREFKTRILEYHCNRIGLRQCQDDAQDESQKRFIVNAMFVYYDKNADEKLSGEELSYGQGSDHIERIAGTCRLTDLLVFRDSSELDGGAAEMSKWEFDLAFGVDMEPQPVATMRAVAAPADELDETPAKQAQRPDEARITPSYVVVNEAMGIQLQCMMDGPDRRIIWDRNGINLSEAKIPSLQVLADNSLYISPIDLHHTGNYSCYDRQAPLAVEVHVITVQVVPVVKVRQVTRRPTEGEMVELQCRVSGIPQPQSASWEVNGYRLPGDDAARYGWANANTTLRILSASRSRDTGVYSCVAETEAGKGHDTVDITGTDDPTATADRAGSMEKTGKFMVFHEDGYTVFDPQLCVAISAVDRYTPDFRVVPTGAESLGILCPPVTPCKWGSAVSAGGRLVYVSQPEERRLIVIDIEQSSRPLQAIALNGRPTSVFYIKHLDQLWVLCEVNANGSKTVSVIKDASKSANQKASRLTTSGNPLDQVSALFMPPSDNDYGYTFPYAFAGRDAHMGFYRIELSATPRAQYVNLSQYECYPRKVDYIEIGGLAVVQCAPPVGLSERRGQLLLFDSVTAVVVPSSLGQGVIYSTPNGRQLVVVNGADHIVVHTVTDEGAVTWAYEEWLSINIGEVRFMPAKSPSSYDMIAYSVDESIVFFMNMDTRKMEMLEGLSTGRKNISATPRLKDLVTTSGPFGKYLILPSKGIIMVVNKNWHNIQCQWSNMKSPASALWLDY